MFGLLLIATACVSTREVLKEKYPYARLTSDYGILNENDLQKNEEDAIAVPFSKDSRAYLYWKCFLTSQIKFSCDNSGDEDQGLPMARMLMRADYNGGYDEYEGRHALPISTCEERLNRWKVLSQGEIYACIAGKYVGPEVGKKQEPGRGSGWIYDRFKTKRGRDSYFENDCILVQELYEGILKALIKIAK